MKLNPLKGIISKKKPIKRLIVVCPFVNHLQKEKEESEKVRK